jgi:mannonate dehydratase
MIVGLGINIDDRATKNFYQFARQIGIRHVTIASPDEDIFPNVKKEGYWTLDDILSYREYLERFGLEIEAFENMPVYNWFDIILDGPRRSDHIDKFKRSIKNMGAAGIKHLGFNFSIAGVYGRVNEANARGYALTPTFDQSYGLHNLPIQKGWVMGKKADMAAPEEMLPPVSLEVMKNRLDRFLDDILPACEDANVNIAFHPEDPPVGEMRGVARVLINPERYNELFLKNRSNKLKIEFCQGVFSEMDGDIYEHIRSFASRDLIAYGHFRNVSGKIPRYYENFVDAGDVDMIKAAKVYHECGFQGVLIPDHTPEVLTATPRQTGMAFQIGYMRAIFKAIGALEE